MAVTDFTVNPSRRNLFEIFRLDKSETGIMAVRQAVREAKERLRFGKVSLRDGAEIEITEAQLNNLQDRLFSPIERLKEEQLVHQPHLFAQDEEFAAGLAALEERGDGLEEVLAEAQTATLQVVGRLLPPIEELRLEDDLPWPAPPEPLVVAREGFAEAILRDR